MYILIIPAGYLSSGTTGIIRPASQVETNTSEVVPQPVRYGTCTNPHSPEVASACCVTFVSQTLRSAGNLHALVVLPVVVPGGVLVRTCLGITYLRTILITSRYVGNNNTGLAIVLSGSPTSTNPNTTTHTHMIVSACHLCKYPGNECCVTFALLQ